MAGRAAENVPRAMRGAAIVSATHDVREAARADLVLLQARNPVEAIRLRATRLLVMRAGKVVARTAPATATLSLEGRPAHVDFRLHRP